MARGPAPDRQAARRRLLLSVVVAALLHATVILLVHLLVHLPPPPMERIPIEVHLVEAPSDAPPGAVPDPQSGERRPRPSTLRPDLPVKERAGGAGRGTGGVATHVDEPGIPPLPEPSTPAGEERIDLFHAGALDESVSRWQAQRGDGTGAGAGARAGHGVGDATGAGRGSGEGEGEGPEAERARVGRRIARDLAQVRAESRVRDGLVDPYFFTLATEMRGNWNPAASLLGGKDGEGRKAGATNLVREWSTAGRTFGESGSPYDRPPPDPGHERARPEGPPEPLPGATPGGLGQASADWVRRWNRGDFASVEGEVLVMLIQSGDGRPRTAEVVASSGDRHLDESARQAVLRAAGRHRPPGGGYGLGGAEIRSLWRLEARMNTSICSPTGCGGTFDEVLGVAELDGFLRTRIRTKVDLIALYDEAP